MTGEGSLKEDSTAGTSTAKRLSYEVGGREKIPGRRDSHGWQLGSGLVLRGSLEMVPWSHTQRVTKMGLTFPTVASVGVGQRQQSSPQR